MVLHRTWFAFRTHKQPEEVRESDCLHCSGRMNRKWESPLGCLMFSIKVPISEGEKHLYELSPHISALAVVLALESIPQFHVDYLWMCLDAGLEISDSLAIRCGRKRLSQALRNY